MTSPQNDLIYLLSEFSLVLPKNAIEWRVAKGEASPFRIPNSQARFGISGRHVLHESVFLLLTDGILGWFLLGDKETLFLGHLSNFIETKNNLPKEKIKKSYNPGIPDLD